MLSFLLVILLPLFVHANPLVKDWAVGVEGGGAAAWMFSDIPTNVTGLGLGKQFSVFGYTQKTEPFGLKFRVERALLHEEALVRADTNQTYTSTLLKAMDQNYWRLDVGVEWRSNLESHIVFWEFGLGYAYGTSGLITVQNTSPDQLLREIEVPVRSALTLSGGGGIRKAISAKLFYTMSLRTFVILNTIYSTGQYQSSSLIPVPFLVNFGLEMPLKF